MSSLAAYTPLLPLVAACSAACSAVLGTLYALQRHVRLQRQQELKQKWRNEGGAQQKVRGGLPDVLADQLQRFASRSAEPKGWLVERLCLLRTAQLPKLLLQAGMADVSIQVAGLWRLRNACVCAAAICLFGQVLSPLAGVLGLVGGFALGWASLTWTLRNLVHSRKLRLDRHISEAIEVMCLGLRAGLSFERSLDLYCANFPSSLAQEFGFAKHLWHTGLLSREEALRKLAATYDSVVFARVVENIVRSLRFGSPLADSLEDLAREARLARRAQAEEAVMKAPVKMMMPIGLLILPSMLLLVMGPIMLELIAGF